LAAKNAKKNYAKVATEYPTVPLHDCVIPNCYLNKTANAFTHQYNSDFKI